MTTLKPSIVEIKFGISIGCRFFSLEVFLVVVIISIIVFYQSIVYIMLLLLNAWIINDLIN